MIERIIRKYTEKFSQFSNSEFGVFDESGRFIAGTKNFKSFEEGVKVEVETNYRKLHLYIKPSTNVEREAQLLKFLYTELLNYEGYIEDLVKELAHRQEDLGIVHDIMAKASLVFDEFEIVKIVMDKIELLISPKACVIEIFGENLNQKYVRGQIQPEVEEEAEKLIKRAVETRNFVIFSPRDGMVRGMLAVPMFSGDNPIGGIFICSADKTFETVEAKLLLTLGNYAGIILYRNKLIDEIKRAEALKKELEIARRIQESLLPNGIPKFEGLDIFAFIKPSSSVGGDYYDFIPGKEKFAFLVADVSGHGIGAALLLAGLRSTIRLSYEIASNISDLIGSVNRIIYKDTSHIGMYSTVFIGEYYPDGMLVYSNAGHIPPVIFRKSDGDIFELEIHGSPVGLFDGEVYGLDKLSLSSGDVIVAFTDGVVETKNENGEFFGIERLKKIISMNGDKSAVEICDAVIREVIEFKGDAEQKDDLTLLIIKKI